MEVHRNSASSKYPFIYSENVAYVLAQTYVNDSSLMHTDFSHIFCLGFLSPLRKFHVCGSVSIDVIAAESIPVSAISKQQWDFNLRVLYILVLSVYKYL